MQGWRKSNEDAHIHKLDLVPGVHLFAVFDGHGGKEVAIYCERHMPNLLIANEDFQNQNYEAALRTVFLKIDKDMISKAGKIELSRIARSVSPYGGVVNSGSIAFNAGCTANVVLVTPNQIICANSGDSRCVVSENGQVFQMSYDHKPSLPSERQRILAAGSFVEDDRVNGIIAMSRALGDWEYKKQVLPQERMALTANPDIRSRAITPNTEFIIVACDGIWDCMTSKQAVDFVNLAKTKQKDFLDKGSSSLITLDVSQQKNARFVNSKSSGFGPSKAQSPPPGLRQAAAGKPRINSKKGPMRGLTVTKQKSAEQDIKNMERTLMSSKFKGLATIAEMIFEKNCASNLMTCEGIGADNMTCIIVEFNQKKPEPTPQPTEMIGIERPKSPEEVKKEEQQQQQQVKQLQQQQF